MTDDRLNSLLGKLTAAGDERKRREAEAAERIRVTENRKLETAQLWPIKRQQLLDEVANLNREIEQTGMQLHAGDPYFIRPAEDRLESYYVGLEPIAMGGSNTAVLQVFVSKSGGITFRVGAKGQLPVKDGSSSVVEVTPAIWREWILNYLEANV